MTKEIARTLIAVLFTVVLVASCSQESSISIPDNDIDQSKRASISIDPYPAELLYTSTHEWIRIGDDSTAFIGLTGHASSGLGDIIEFDGIVDEDDDIIVVRPDTIGTIKGLNYDKSLHTPVDAILAESNAELETNPSLIADYPYTSGWIMKLRSVNLSQLSDLMTSAQYEAYVNTL